MYASNHTHAVDYSQHDADRSLHFAGRVMSLQILSYECESDLRHHPASSCSLSDPARTTLMTSAVKTKSVRISSSAPCPTAGPRGPVLARGRSQESGLGGSRCLVRRKLNNFKVHLVKRRKTYFNTSFTLYLALVVGAPPLYVCLRQCERVKVCVILQCISILLHLCGQKGVSGIKCITTPF